MHRIIRFCLGASIKAEEKCKEASRFRTLLPNLYVYIKARTLSEVLIEEEDSLVLK